MCNDFCDTLPIESSKYRVILSTFADKLMILSCFSSLLRVLARLINSFTFHPNIFLIYRPYITDII